MTHAAILPISNYGAIKVRIMEPFLKLCLCNFPLLFIAVKRFVAAGIARPS